MLELQLAVYARGCARDDCLVLYWGGRVCTGKLSGSEIADIAGHRYTQAHYDTLLKDLRKHGQ